MSEMFTTRILKKLNEPGIKIDPEVFEKLLASDGEVGDLFGSNVVASADGLTVVVSTPYSNDKGPDSGSAYIFTKQANGSYLQTQKLILSDGVAHDGFGYTVAITEDGTTVIISAPWDDDKGNNSGSVRVYTKQANGSYLETQKLLASDGAAGDYFGWSVAVSGDGLNIVAGAIWDDSRGSAYIFTKQTNGSYLQSQKLVASDGATGDEFGWSVAVSPDGTTVVVGALYDSDKGTNSGSVYIFTKQAIGNYLQSQKLVASDGAANEYFGGSVAVSNTSVMIGAQYHLGKGVVYVY